MSGQKILRIRLVLSVLMGLAVAFVPLYLVVGGPSSRDLKFQRKYTRSAFKTVERMLEAHRRQHGSYPSTLKEFGYEKQDGWGRPMLYSVHNGVPLLESLGRDGVRGGIGTDADLSNQNPSPPQIHVPFWTRITDPDALQMTLAACISGLFATFLCFSGLQSQTFSPSTLPLLGFSLLLSLGIAAFGAIIITIVHVPSGH
ncbi:hypothetical protein EON83_04685 [bacterium]|nr:MAG: hypothetical protein EON83_04685 [bacterium]